MRTLAVLVLLLVLWEAAYLIIGDVALASPFQVFARIVELLTDARFWPHAEATLTALGRACATTWPMGVLIGVILGVSKRATETAEPLFAAVYSLPKIVLYPVVLLFFGIGMPAKIAFGVINSIFPVVMFTMNAVKNMNPVYLRTARVLQLTAPAAFWKIILPAAMPEILTVMRLSFSLALLGVLLGEMFAAEFGVGRMLVQAMHTYNVVQLLAVTLLISGFAFLGNLMLLGIERLITRNSRAI